MTLNFKLKNNMTDTTYIKALESTGLLSEPAIKKAMQLLKLNKGHRVLDVPCGTGSHALWLLEKYPDIKITGVDIAQAQVNYAKEKLTKAHKSGCCEFIIADMNKLEFADNTFDLVSCCDGLWPGPQEMGCPAEKPYDILKNLERITKPGGKIAVLFWSSQKLLPGYPFIEAKLNTTKSANMPSFYESTPELYFMRTPEWFQKTGLQNISVQTFASDISAPLNEVNKKGLHCLFDMFWSASEAEVSKDIWNKYTEITNPQSDKYILNQPGYTGFLTYTMSIGEVVK
jgi:ubiquinone/menaquinone biosynthesis C-methylase UbiE